MSKSYRDAVVIGVQKVCEKCGSLGEVWSQYFESECDGDDPINLNVCDGCFHGSLYCKCDKCEKIIWEYVLLYENNSSVCKECYVDFEKVDECARVYRFDRIADEKYHGKCYNCGNYEYDCCSKNKDYHRENEELFEGINERRELEEMEKEDSFSKECYYCSVRVGVIYWKDGDRDLEWEVDKFQISKRRGKLMCNVCELEHCYSSKRVRTDYVEMFEEYESCGNNVEKCWIHDEIKTRLIMDIALGKFVDNSEKMMELAKRISNI